MGSEGEESIIQRTLGMTRALTGMELVILAEIDGGHHVVTATDHAAEVPAPPVGHSSHLEATFCQRVIDGRVERRLPDTQASAATAVLPAVTEKGIRSFVGVPVRLPDGHLHGALCAMDRRPGIALDDRDFGLFEQLADMLGEHLERTGGQARAERARDELLQSVTHDLRTPLMAMRFLGEDLKADGGPTARAGAQVEQEASRVLELVEDLMLVARQRAGAARLQLAKVDLVALATEAATRLRRSLGRECSRTVALDVPDGPLETMADGSRVLRALQNLLDNACHYSPKGSGVELALRCDGPTALFEVRDCGMGIDATEIPLLTDRFYRSPRAVEAGLVGTGLGLATVLGVAAMHEGTLRVSSELGVGSTFELRLPLRASPSV